MDKKPRLPILLNFGQFTTAQFMPLILTRDHIPQTEFSGLHLDCPSLVVVAYLGNKSSNHLDLEGPGIHEVTSVTECPVETK